MTPTRKVGQIPLIDAEAPGGERVGALCVMNRVPRQFTERETATLRDLALRAQQVLWESRAS